VVEVVLYYFACLVACLLARYMVLKGFGPPLSNMLEAAWVHYLRNDDHQARGCGCAGER